MRRIAAVLYATCALWVASLALSSAETLYYLDQQRNVSAVNVEGSPSRATRHRVLSTAGGYHGFCVSPDETQVFGWKEIGKLWEDFPVFKCFLEQQGRQQERIGGPVMADEEPSAQWLPGNSHLLITFPLQVETQSVLYSVRGRKVTCDTKDAISTFSFDQRYCFVEEDIGHDADGAAKLRLLDAHSGKTAHVTSVRYAYIREIPPYTWLGNSNRFAVMDASGRVLAGEVRATPSGPSVRTWHLTRYSGCSDLRYLPGKGVYFVQTSGKSRRAYISADLRRLARTPLLPRQTAKPYGITQASEGRLPSPSKKLVAVAEAGPSGQAGIIVVVDDAGHRLVVGRGTRPRWKGGNWW